METLEDEYSVNRILDPSQPSESSLKLGAHNLMTEVSLWTVGTS